MDNWLDPNWRFELSNNVIGWIVVAILAAVGTAVYTKVKARRKRNFSSSSALQLDLAEPRTDPQPRISIEVTGGKSADLNVKNIGGPFTLIARGRLVNVMPPYTIDSASPYEFEPRQIDAGDVVSTYTIARVHGSITGLWNAYVFGERMAQVQHWAGKEGLWFDVEWIFQCALKAERRTIATVVTRVTLDQQKPRLDAKVLDNSKNESQFRD